MIWSRFFLKPLNIYCRIEDAVRSAPSPYSTSNTTLLLYVCILYTIIITVGAECAAAAASEVTGEKDDFSEGTRRCSLYNIIIYYYIYTGVAAAVGSR